jgi:hypothetical protein
MSYLTVDELPTYCPEVANMTAGDKTKYLNRANGYAFGVIGGIPAYTDQLPATTVKIAVAMAFEIFAEGQEAQTNTVNGNITEAAPTGHYVRKADDPLAVVDKMLQPYKEAFEAQNTALADNGIMFL